MDAAAGGFFGFFFGKMATLMQLGSHFEKF